MVLYRVLKHHLSLASIWFYEKFSLGVSLITRISVFDRHFYVFDNPNCLSAFPQTYPQTYPQACQACPLRVL